MVDALTQKGGNVWTTETAGPSLLRRIEDLEQELANFRRRVSILEDRTLRQQTRELDELKAEVGKLKIEIEEMREE